MSILISTSSMNTSINSISPPPSISITPSAVPPPPQTPPQSMLPSTSKSITVPASSSISMLVTWMAPASPSIESNPSPLNEA